MAFLYPTLRYQKINLLQEVLKILAIHKQEVTDIVYIGSIGYEKEYQMSVKDFLKQADVTFDREGDNQPSFQMLFKNGDKLATTYRCDDENRDGFYLSYEPSIKPNPIPGTFTLFPNTQEV